MGNKMDIHIYLKLAAIEDYIQEILFYGSVKNGKPVSLPKSKYNLPKYVRKRTDFFKLWRKYSFVNLGKSSRAVSLSSGFRIKSKDYRHILNIENFASTVLKDNCKVNDEYCVVLFVQKLSTRIEEYVEEHDLKLEKFSDEGCYYRCRDYFYSSNFERDFPKVDGGDFQYVFPYVSGNKVGPSVECSWTQGSSVILYEILKQLFGAINPEECMLFSPMEDEIQFLEYCANPKKVFICNGLSKMPIHFDLYDKGKFLTALCKIEDFEAEFENSKYVIVKNQMFVEYGGTGFFC